MNPGTTPLWRSPAVVAALILALALAFHACMPRYQPMGTGRAHVLDTWTGEVCYGGTARCR